MRVLILDDLQERHDIFDMLLDSNENTLYHAYTHAAAIVLLYSQSAFDTVYLDYNLGTTDITGLDTAKYIAEILPKHKRPREVIVHSADVMGAPKMLRTLKSGGVKARLEEFGSRCF
jgi:CheY-like chemotaxis protein